MAGCVFLCVVLLHLAGVLQVVPAGSVAVTCGRASKLCQDGSECVLYDHVCDGEPDCRDESDEDNCPSECSEDQFQCAHGRRCIQLVQVCDGEAHCQDRSDEADCLTKTDSCDHHCDSRRRCLPANLLCDGEKDCQDGSDEDGCEDPDMEEGTVAPATSVDPIKCPLGSRQCRNGDECILHDHMCDGEPDCRDGSDEDECPLACDTDQFQCAHGRKCIERSQVCDGASQCQDRSDELGCSELVEGCSHQCDDRSRCIPDSFLCDRERDCLDGSDEANCEDKSCSATEFKCSSGQCVAATMLCDGHPDCWDGSDEESCTNMPVCPTKLRCPHSKECLLEEWRCDGEQDCRDGTDEKNCSVALVDCAEFQWSCKSRIKCVSASWRCDGTKDCDDGSDEAECGGPTCPPHQFQCGSQECVDTPLVCNGVINCADGSDEGGSCQTSCSEADSSRCSQICSSSPQGPRCVCAAGFRLLEDGFTCADIDECESATVCGQLCINSPGSYRCDCQPGYSMGAGGHQCKIPGEPFLLTSVQTDLFLLGLRSRSLDVLSSSAKKAILSVDYDWRERKVYWVTVDTDTIRWSSLDQKTTGTLIKGVRADSVALDWLGRNLYWIDGVRSQIVAISLARISEDSADYSVILDEDLDQPRSLAVLPQKGLMFWTEIGNVVKIERAGMDGSERRVVVNSSLGWPGGVTVDTVSDRVYWTDERLKSIGSAALDGSDIRILQVKETANPFSLAVFNEHLYWTDAKRRVVLSAHKTSGKNSRVLLKRLQQPFGVKIIHPLLQTGTEDPCQWKGCSHMCVLAPGPAAVCRCPSGLLLSEDGLSCSSQVDSAFLLMLSPSSVTQIYLQSRHTVTELKGWPEHLVLQVPSVNEAAIMDYRVREDTLFLTDDSRSSLSSFRLKDSEVSPQGQLFRLLGDTISAMALDWVTLNIYWSSNKQPRLQVTSITAAHTAVLLMDGVGRVESIALHPPRGSLCFSNLDLQGSSTVATVECSNMDGGGRRVVWKDAVHATSLVFSTDGETVYWADTGLGSIGSVQVDGSGFRELKADGVAAVALSDDTLLWMTVGDKTQLWFRDEQQRNTLWFEVGTEVVGLKAFSRSSQTGLNQCTENNGGCQHLCLATPQGRTCRCAHNYMLVNATHCQPEQRCSAGSQPCLDQLSCQPAEKFCDGHADCPDHSDENCVSLEARSRALVPPPVSSRSPMPPTAPHPTPSEASGLDTTLNISSQFNVLDAAECSKRRCSGNGRCENNRCVCSLVYRGDSCQDHVLQMVQGPVVYGAAALCAGVLVVVVAVVVAVKRRTSSRGVSSAVVKETRMNMQDRAETTQSCLSSAAEADKPEEAVSSGD